MLRAEHIAKSFGQVTALTGRQPASPRGEVLGLLGDNGAGKSTLMKIFTGYHQPSAGQLFFDGKPVTLRSVSQARALGVEAVYQDLALINQLNVFQNMFLQREPVHGGLLGILDERTMRAAGEGAARTGRRQHPVGRCRGGQALRRPAPGDRGRAVGLSEGEGSAARRADRGDGRQGVGADPRPHPAPEGGRATWRSSSSPTTTPRSSTSATGST